MRPILLCACLLALVAAAARAQPDPLARARALYNARNFDGALEAADEARRAPVHADSADLIAARAYLEKYRETAMPDDLASARERLRRINVDRLDSRERSEFLVGLGEDLYFDESVGAAANLFDSLLASPMAADRLGPSAHELVLDWWASALDREARPRPDIERQAVYERIRARMREELSENPASASASYWLAAAALAQGDVQAAWDAALAGWVRAPLAVDRGAGLRGDLDLLVERGIVPERSKRLAQPPEIFQAEWDAFKEKWNK